MRAYDGCVDRRPHCAPAHVGAQCSDAAAAGQPAVALSSRRLLLGWVVAVTAVKFWLAWRLPLFGDEAFYRLEARALAWSYSDVPPLTPWLIALGMRIGGDHAIAMRAPFLLLGLALPLLLLAWARQFVGSGEARAAVLLALLMPLSASLGVLALPDVPLTLVWVLLAWVLARVLRHGRAGDYVLLGVVLALGWLSHYRFALAYVAGLVLLVATPGGRRLARDPRFWLAQLLGLAGLAPALHFNLDADFAALRFQFVDRHPWRFEPEGLLEALVQATVATPALYAVLLVAIAQAWRSRPREDAPCAVLAALAGGVLGGLILLAPWLDRERVSFHWSLPGLLLATPLAPAVLRRWSAESRVRRWLARLAAPLATLASLALFALLVHASRPAPADARGFGRPLPDNLQGGREIADFARRLHARIPHEVLIAGDFMLGARLDQALGGRVPVWVLDHPRNARHGRAAQLALWRRDEAALFAEPGWTTGLLLVEETALREIERVPAWLALCARFDAVAPVAELLRFGGRLRVVALTVTRHGGGLEPRCRLPAQADFLVPLPDAQLPAAAVELSGWAIADFIGVGSVELLLDGASLGEAALGDPFPGVAAQWPMSQDPRHPHVGWRARIDLSGQGGRRWLALRVTDAEGRTRELAGRWVRIGDPR